MARAQWQMGESWRIGVDPAERTGLVTTGIFARIRTPIFTAMLLTGVGFALMVGNWVALVGLVALIAALEVRVRAVEGPYLAGIHGTTYRSYASAAGRFLPGVGWRALHGRRRVRHVRTRRRSTRLALSTGVWPLPLPRRVALALGRVQSHITGMVTALAVDRLVDSPPGPGMVHLHQLTDLERLREPLTARGISVQRW